MPRFSPIPEEHRAVIKLCVKLGVTLGHTTKLINRAFGTNTQKGSFICWYQDCKNGRESIFGPCRRYASSKDDIAKVCKGHIRNMSPSWFATKVSLKGSAFDYVMAEIKKQVFHGRVVPSTLTRGQKQTRYDHCTNIIDTCRINSRFLDSLIVGGKTWFSVGQSRSPDEAGTLAQESINLVMFVSFYDSKGIIHCETGIMSTIGEEEEEKRCSYQVMEKVWHHIVEYRPEYRAKEQPSFYLLLDTSLDSISVHKFWADRRVCVFYQPPDSPDLSPCDYFLLNEIRRQLWGQELPNYKSFAARMKVIMNKIRYKNQKDCSSDLRNQFIGKSFHELLERAEKCKEENGNYV